MQLFQRLRDQDPAVTPALGLLEERLVAQGTTAEETVRLEHQRQATMNVTVRNVITSMRLISSLDWAQFVEGVGVVDRIMRQDSSFAELDFDTRDAYRKAIEELARGSAWTESDVAEKAIAMAKSPPGFSDRSEIAPRYRDPGYYLVSDGRALLERELAVRPAVSTRLRRAYIRFPSTGYLGTMLLLTAASPGCAPRAIPGPRCHVRRHRHHHVVCCDTRIRPRGRPREPDGHQDPRPETTAAPRPRRRSATGTTHVGRRSDAADEHRRHRVARRWLGGALPGEPRG